MAPSWTGSIRWLTLRDLGLGEKPELIRWPAIQAFRERELLEDGVLETVYRSDSFGDLAHRQFVTRSDQVADLVLAGVTSVDQGSAIPSGYLRQRGRVTGVRFADDSEITARLTIVTSGNRSLVSARDRSFPGEKAPPLLQRTEIIWLAESDAGCARTTVTGDGLDHVGAVATTFRSLDRLALSMVVSTKALIREAVVVTDIIGSFLNHPAHADLPDLETAASATSGLLTLPERVNLDQFGAGYLVLGKLEGLSDSTSFDREVNVADDVARELCDAPVERFGSVSLQCAIAGRMHASQWARREGTLPGHDRSRCDSGGPDFAIARTARPSPV